MASTSTPKHAPTKATSLTTISNEGGGRRRRNHGRNKRWLNHELDETINQLDIKATHLLNSSSDVITMSQKILSPDKKNFSDSRLSNKLANLSLSDLVNNSSDQKTLTSMSKELDAQSDQNEMLIKTLLRTTREPAEQETSLFHYPSTCSLLDQLQPLSSSFCTFSISSLPDYLLSSKTLSSGLHNQDEFLELRTKLEDNNAIIEKQKEQFHSALEDFRKKYEIDIATKDAFLRATEKDVSELKVMLRKTQQLLQQLIRTNDDNQKVIVDLKEKLEIGVREKNLLEDALDQVRGQVLDQEHKRGRPFYEGTPILDQDSLTFMRSIETCLQLLDMDLEVKKEEVQEMTAKFLREKEVYEDKERKLKEDHQHKLNVLMREHEETVAMETEQVVLLKKRISFFEDEAKRQRKQLEHDLHLKDCSLSDLERRLLMMTDEFDSKHKAWKNKRENLEKNLDETQDQLTLMKIENNKIQEELSLKNCDLDSRIEDLKHMTDKELESENKRNVFERELEKKTTRIEGLEKKIEIIRYENETRLKEMATNVEKEDKENSEHQIQSLVIQVNALTEKYHRLTLDFELTKTNHQNLLEKYSDLKSTHDIIRSQHEMMSATKVEINSLCSERLNQVKHLSQERDFQMKATEAAMMEASALRCHKDRLTVQLEEREKNFLSLKEENERMKSLIYNQNKATVSSRKENDESEGKLKQVTTELNEVKLERDSLKRKISNLEKFEIKIQRTDEEMKEIRFRFDKTLAENESFTVELKEAKNEIVSRKQELNFLRRSFEKKDGNLEKELNRMSKKLQNTENDLELAKKALETHKEVDGKAVVIASKVQKEVTQKRTENDSLYSKIRQLQQNLDSVIQEKKVLEEGNEILSGTIIKTAEQRDQLADELRLYIFKHSQLQRQFTSLETTLDKMTRQQTTAVKEAEQLTQDSTRLKLKHQLELKEMERKYGGKEMLNNGILDASSAYYTPTSISNCNPHHDSSNLNHYDVEYPISLKPIQTKEEKERIGDNSDLKCLLEEIKKLSFEKDLHHDKNPKIEIIGKSGFDLTSVSVQSNSSHLESDGNVKVRRMKEDERPTRDVQSKQNPIHHGSSVFHLLTGQPSDDDHLEMSSGSKKKKKKEKQSVSLDTKSLYDQLQKRIESLTQIGGNLQKENQDIAKGMIDHARRMKKIKKYLEH